MIDISTSELEVNNLKFQSQKYQNEVDMLTKTKATLAEQQKEDKQIELFLKGVQESEQKRKELEQFIQNINDDYKKKVEDLKNRIDKEAKGIQKNGYDKRTGDLVLNL